MPWVIADHDHFVQGCLKDSVISIISQSSEVLLAQFSLYVHKGGLKPDSFHFYDHFDIDNNCVINSTGPSVSLTSIVPCRDVCTPAV